MSYIPTEWKTGDIVTAEKLNKLEEGVASGGGGGGGLLITIDAEGDNPAYLDKTYSEILSAINAGIMPVVMDTFHPEGEYIVFTVKSGREQHDDIDGNRYYVVIDDGSDEGWTFEGNSATGVLIETT